MISSIEVDGYKEWALVQDSEHLIDLVKDLICIDNEVWKDHGKEFTF